MSGPGLVTRLLYLGHRLRMRGGDQTDTGTTADAAQDFNADVAPDRPDGVVIWMHAADAEDAAALPALTQELARLRGEPVHGLLTSTRGNPPHFLRDTVITQRAPPETSQTVEAFLDHCRPDALICQGLPDRPKLIAAARERGLPMYLTAPRRGLGDRSLPALAGAMVKEFDMCLAPSGADARLLRARTRDQDQVITTGPMSDTAVALPCDEADLAEFAAEVSSRPIWLALRPDPSEIAGIEAAHREAARSAHRLLLILAPDDPSTGAALAAVFEPRGWRIARRSLGERPTSNVQVFIADGDDSATDEELWFRLSPIVYLGGTLDGARATDPFRPAAHGAALIAGPKRFPVGARLERLKAANALATIDREDQLGTAVTRLLSPDHAAELALAGWSVTSESAHVIDRLARILDDALTLAEAS